VTGIESESEASRVRPCASKTSTRAVIAGTTLAVLTIPEVTGYRQISGTPAITALDMFLIPMALCAIFGSSRHLVVAATAVILAAGLDGKGGFDAIGKSLLNARHQRKTERRLAIIVWIMNSSPARTVWRQSWRDLASVSEGFSPKTDR
jgi:hypothetical protein